jgi:hypothetical protein
VCFCIPERMEHRIGLHCNLTEHSKMSCAAL